MKTLKKYFTATLACLSFLVSCSEELDFEQFDDVEVTPTIESSIFFLEIPENIINLLDINTNRYSQDFEFNAFNEDLFARRVIEGSIFYEIENTTSKPIDITIEFLDAMGASLDIEFFSLTSEQTMPRETTYGTRIGDKSLDIITNTSLIIISATNNGDNSSVNMPNSKIILKSKGEFKVRLK